jgi:thiol-disulfide isomerase/thioredoxin
MPRNFFVVILIVMLSACNTSAPTAIPTAMPNQISKQTPGAGPVAGIQIVLVQSVITVGQNRFAIGLLDGDSFVKNARLDMTFFNLVNGAKEAGTVGASYRESPDGAAGMYTVEMNFPNAGSWGVAVKGTGSDGKPIDQRASFEVVASSSELAVGQKAPAAKSPTLIEVGGDLKRITSASKPNAAFYQISLDKAIASGKPTLVQFSTPAFCTSRLCGPAYDMLQAVYPGYGDKLNIIHVEVYTDLPNPNLSKPQIAAAMGVWGLKTEPWTYLLDKNGVVVWRAEGLVTADEASAEIDRLLKTQ